MNLSEFSVKNSLFVNALSVFLVVTGLIAAFQIEREAFPEFSFDIVTVTTIYPGSTPEVVEKRITIPLEKELKEVNDIKKMESISLEGRSLVILTLEPNIKNVDRVINDIQRAVDQADDLPEDLEEEPLVLEIETEDSPLVEVSLSGNLSEGDLRQIALRLETEILELSQVSSVIRKGMRDREIWVEVDPVKMAAYEVSLSEVMQALALRNINIAGGLHKENTTDFILRTSGELSSSEDVSSVILRANEDGHWVQVKDIANVFDAFEEDQIIERTDGTRAINLMVIKKNEADAIRLMEDLQVLLDDFKTKESPELRLSLVNDISYYIKRRLNVLISNGWIGFLFVLIPMVIFLSGRVATGAAVGMGVAILTAFAGMHIFGISINLISMFGLIMVLGMLVDEDLVVADNITRYLEEGYSHREASIRGASEVSRAIISTVLTTIIVFVPLLFMTGIMGKFCADIPKVVMITLAASLIEALIILPSHLSDLSRPRREGAQSAFEKKKQHHLYERFRDRYLKSLRYCLKRPIKTVLVSAVITIAAILYGVFGIQFILFPAKGIEAFFVRAEAPLGSSLEATEKMMVPIENLVATLPKNELDHWVTQVGIIQNDPSDPFTRRGSQLAQIAVYLTPETKRDRMASDIVKDLQPQLEAIQKTSGFDEIRFEEINPGPPVGKPVAVRLRGEEYAVLDPLANEYKEFLKTVKGVKNVRDDHEPGKGELQIQVDEKVATQAGLTYQDIALTVRQAFEGMKATTIRKTEDEIDVVVRLPEVLRKDFSAVESLLIPNKAGNLVPLNRVARLEKTSGISAIKHFDSKRTVTVTADVDEEITTSVEVNALIREKFPDVLKEHSGVTVHYGGEEEDTKESMSSLFRAFLIAVFLIFVVLFVTFGSILQSFLILLAIPCGVVGVVIGFALAGEPFGFLALLGVVGLTGIVVDGGTLIFVFINRMKGTLKESKEDLKEMIVKGCGVRLRSILLTTLTTVLGVVPAAYGIGGNDPFIRPMALALNWGIGGSIFFTLYTLPCLYYLAEMTSRRFKQKLASFRDF